MTESDPLAAARMRWRAAEEYLYPALIADPDGYRRTIGAIGRLTATLRDRDHDDPAGLLAAESDPVALLAQAGVPATGLPVDLVIGAACGARDRELAAAANRRAIQRALAEAERTGAAWAVLAGPADPAQLTEGAAVALHRPTGAVLTAAVDPLSPDAPFALRVVAADGETTAAGYTDRDAWLAAYRERRAELAASGPDRSGAT